jgi:hypothetical protein
LQADALKPNLNFPNNRSRQLHKPTGSHLEPLTLFLHPSEAKAFGGIEAAQAQFPGPGVKVMLYANGEECWLSRVLRGAEEPYASSR